VNLEAVSNSTLFISQIDPSLSHFFRASEAKFRS